jgi:hypothetical protein
VVGADGVWRWVYAVFAILVALADHPHPSTRGGARFEGWAARVCPGHRFGVRRSFSRFSASDITPHDPIQVASHEPHTNREWLETTTPDCVAGTTCPPNEILRHLVHRGAVLQFVWLSAGIRVP